MAAKRQYAEIVDLTDGDDEQNVGNSKKLHGQLEADSHDTIKVDISITDRLLDFSIVELREFLQSIAQTFPTIGKSIESLHNAKIQEQKGKVIRFDDYSISLWRKLNKDYSSLSGSAQYEKAFDVYYETLEDIEDIVKQAGPIASDETRRNALEGLRKIGKTLCLSGGNTLAHEVNKHLQGGKQMTEAMLAVADTMSDEQIMFVRESWKPDGTRLFIETLDELVALSQDECIFAELEVVLEALGVGSAADAGEEDGDAGDGVEDEATEPISTTSDTST